MSLLMDALKRAHEAKEARRETVAPKLKLIDEANPLVPDQSEPLPLDSGPTHNPDQLKLVSQAESTATHEVVNWDEQLLPEFRVEPTEKVETNAVPVETEITETVDTLASDFQLFPEVAMGNSPESVPAQEAIQSLDIPNTTAEPPIVELESKPVSSIESTNESAKSPLLTEIGDAHSTPVDAPSSHSISPPNTLSPNIHSVFTKPTIVRDMPPSDNPDPESAQRVLAAGKRPTSNHIGWLLALLVVILFVMGGGYYYYTSTINTPPLIPGSKTLKPIVVVGPVTGGAEIEPTPPPTISGAVSPDSDSVSGAVSPANKKNSQEMVRNSPKETNRTPNSPKPKAASANSQKDSSVAPGTPKIAKMTSPHQNYTLTDAYNALQRGDNATADRLYKRVLQQDSNNRDALLGLAAIAMRRGDTSLAQQHYTQLLRLYPNDSLAQVGLISALGNSPENESLLKSLANSNSGDTPQTAYVYFSLGNLYVAQGQWEQAQQAYFDAYRLDKNQADYAYNLAVSLDQLNQSRYALTYYQQALQLAQQQARNSYSFNPQFIHQRIQTLTTYLGNVSGTNPTLESTRAIKQ